MVLNFRTEFTEVRRENQQRRYIYSAGSAVNNNIEQRFTPICSPQTNGMAERGIRTIKEKTIYKNNYRSVEELKADIADFTMFYNLERKHYGIAKELGLRTPLDAISFWFEKKPELFHCEPNFFKEKIVNCEKIIIT